MGAESTNARGFSLTRVIMAPRRRVFAAWTEPEHLAWFYNPAMPTPTTPIKVDLRVDGVWRQQMVVNDELQYPTGGVYLDVVDDERLVFRWGAVGGWPDLTGELESEAPIVTVELGDVDEGTELVLTVAFSDHLTDDDVRSLIEGGTRDGWGATIDRVALSTALSD